MKRPADWPFYYGWVIVVAGGLGSLATVPGQTIGVSVFNDYLIEALGIGRVAISSAYLIGTTVSALFLARAGRLIDRHGSRVVGTVAAFALALSVFAMTGVDRAAAAASGLAGGAIWPAFASVTIGFFLLRLFGQGVLSMSSRTMVARWFDKRRGIVSAAMGLSVTLGFSYSPRFFESLIERHGWRGAWLIIGAALVVFAGVAAAFYRDSPAACGLQPDGLAPSRAPGTPTPPAAPPRVAWRRLLPPRLRELRPVGLSTGEDRTLREARSTVSFWVFLLVLTTSSMIGTAFTFHVVSIFGETGMGRSAAVAVFLPASVVSLVVQFATSWASDYVSIRVFPILHAAALIFFLVSMSLLGSTGSVALVVFSHGLMQGMLTVNGTLAWPRLYGLRHLGAIIGYAAIWGVVGSAVGPYLFSVFFDLTGTYRIVSLVLIVPCAALVLVATVDYRRAKRSAG